jgi:hypothetical protein
MTRNFAAGAAPEIDIGWLCQPKEILTQTLRMKFRVVREFA